MKTHADNMIFYVRKSHFQAYFSKFSPLRGEESLSRGRFAAHCLRQPPSLATPTPLTRTLDFALIPSPDLRFSGDPPTPQGGPSRVVIDI